MNGFGEVVEYLLEPQRCLTATTSDNDDSSIDLTCLPKLRWPLLRYEHGIKIVIIIIVLYSKSTDEYNPLPFNNDNPLIKAHNDYKRFITQHSNSKFILTLLITMTMAVSLPRRI